MKLNEKFYARIIYGLAECDGKRINSDYAVVRGWFIPNKKGIDKRNRYYVIHIKSGLAITATNYNTIKEAIDNFETDLEYALNKIKEHGKDFDEYIQIAIDEFNNLMEKEVFL